MSNNNNAGQTVVPAFAFTQLQLANMLELQATTNEIMVGKNADWLSGELNFRLAAVVEAAEAVSANGYKWWKHETPNTEHTIMECVDVLHFLLSYICVKHSTKHSQESGFTIENFDFNDFAAETLSSVRWASRYKFNDDLTSKNLVNTTMFSVIGYICVDCPHAAYDELLNAFGALGVDPATVYRKFVGKAMLNRFRSLNGQADGTYIRDWNGTKDEDVLLSYLSLNPDAPLSHIQQHLNVEYAKVENALFDA